MRKPNVTGARVRMLVEILETQVICSSPAQNKDLSHEYLLLQHLLLLYE